MILEMIKPEIGIIAKAIIVSCQEMETIIAMVPTISVRADANCVSVSRSELDNDSTSFVIRESTSPVLVTSK